MGQVTNAGRFQKKTAQEPKKETTKIYKHPWTGGTATLRLRGGFYYMDVIARGQKRKKGSTKKSDLAEAVDHLRGVLAKIDENPGSAPQPKARITILDVMNEYIAQTKGEWSATTLSGYETNRDHFKPIWGHLHPSQLTSQMIADYRLKRKGEAIQNGLPQAEEAEKKRLDASQRSEAYPQQKKIRVRKARAPKPLSERRKVGEATCNRELAFLRAALNYKCEMNPQVIATVPKFKMVNVLKRNRRDGFITLIDFETKLLPLLPFHLKALVYCALIWGGRKNEWLSLDWEDIDFRHMRIRFPRTKTDNPRENVILPGTMELLLRALQKEHKLTCGDEPAVFTYEGRRLTDFRSGWNTAVRKSGLKLRGKHEKIIFHDTRRSSGQIQRDMGLSRDEIKRNSGWETDFMFNHYGIQPEGELDAVRQKATKYLRKHSTLTKNSPVVVSKRDSKRQKRAS